MTEVPARPMSPASLDDDGGALNRDVSDIFEAGRIRLQTLILLRWLAVGGQAAAVLFTALVLGFELPLELCLAAVAASAWLNIILTLRYPAPRRLGEMARNTAVIVGVALGVVAAIWHNSWIDYLAVGVSIGAQVLPNFVMAPILVLVGRLLQRAGGLHDRHAARPADGDRTLVAGAAPAGAGPWPA